MGPFVGGALASVDDTHSSSTSAIKPTGQPVESSIGTINITDDLAVWERAPFRPVTVDRQTGPDSPATTVNSPKVTLEGFDIGTSNEVIFEEDDEVRINLDGSQNLPKEEFRVLVTRIDANQDTTEVFLNSQNISVEEVERAFEDVDRYGEFESSVQDQNEVRFGTVRDFFNETDQFETFAESFAENQTLTTERFKQALSSDEFLDLTSFKTVTAGEIRDDGSQEATVNLDESGTYILIGHIGDKVYEEGDERPRFNNTTALGIDAVTAQESASKIDLDSDQVEPGENVSLTATAGLSSNANISHAVVVFDEETFSEGETQITVDGGFSRDVRAEDVTVGSPIAEIQGVANVQPNVQISGTEIASEEFSGTVSTKDQADSFFDIRNALVDGFDIRDQAGDAATFNTIGTTTLNASMTAIGDASGEETIEVETLEGWQTGEYTVLHIAADQEDGTISTSRTDIQIDGSGDDNNGGGETPPDDDDDDDGTGGGSGGGGTGGTGGTGGADDGDNGDDTQVDPPEPPANVEIEADETVALEFDENAGRTTATFGEDNAVESVSFEGQQTGTVNARTLSAAPDETGPTPGSSATVAQINVGSALMNSEATVRKRVTRDRLDNIGADAEDLTAFRFADGEWQTLDTEVADENDQRVVVEFQTPGFSYFAVSATGEPTAAIDAPSEIEAGDEVTLDASGSETEYGEIVSYDWSVDGESLSGETATATLDEAGDVSVELTVENDAGETDTASATITVTQVDDGDGTGTGDGDGGDGGDGDDGGNLGLALVLVLFGLLIAGGFIYYLNVQE